MTMLPLFLLRNVWWWSPATDPGRSWHMRCRWDDFFGNCTALFKRKCKVDVMVSISGALGCIYTVVSVARRCVGHLLLYCSLVRRPKSYCG